MSDDFTQPEGLPALQHRPSERRPGPVKAFFERHGRKLWWMHSFYALSLGAFVVTYAQRGLEYIRWITLLLIAAWLIVLVIFRTVGSGRDQRIDSPAAKLRFHFMTYVLKNLYQGMLFFLLPFYWKSSTAQADNRWFVGGLAFCALLATLDVVFDRVLMRWRLLGSVYYVVTLVAMLNLAFPVFWPLPSATALVLATGVGIIGFWTLNFPMRRLREPRFAISMLASLGLGLVGVYGARWVVPPVPLTLAAAAVGPKTLPDGRLALEVTSLHHSLMREMAGVTDILTPAGPAENFVHIWRQSGAEVLRLKPDATPVPKRPRVVRLRSALRREQLPENRVGDWSLDVETEAGQIVGRFRFEVTP